MKSYVTVDIDIGEITDLMDCHWKIYSYLNTLTEKELSRMTMAGLPLKETARRHHDRYFELKEIKNRKWPK